MPTFVGLGWAGGVVVRLGVLCWDDDWGGGFGIYVDLRAWTACDSGLSCVDLDCGGVRDWC